ncbi:polypeptide deformylase [Helicosporidium sp. ATCC 50920]|nr:polypeptide deformylase [Helicosporidium sp. ATCC 50920]|eukprot:KDD75090.1 polypeptide deformylase [Helicosporidium sp. ATCC 50920]
MVLASWATRVARRSLVGASCCVQTSVHMRRLSVAAPAHGPASCSPKRAVSQGHYLPLFVRPAALFRASLGERTYSTALEWKPPLKVITYPDPRLRAPNRTIETFDGTLERLASDMLDAMYQCVVHDGVGLAAPQVGVNVNMLVMNEAGTPEDGDEIVMVNPEIVELENDLESFEEGCLSFPGIYADVVRPSAVTVKAQDVAGVWKTHELDGFKARIFLHEMDHLQGILFHDRMEEEAMHGIEPDLAALEEAAGGDVRVPGEMPDVFLEKMIQASHTLLNVTRELKRNAMLNDFESRNSQVDEEAARLKALIEERKREIKALEALALPSI